MPHGSDHPTSASAPRRLPSLPVDYKQDVNFAPYHTLGLKSSARYLTEITDESQLYALWHDANARALLQTVIGQGSNIVPGDLDGLVGVMAIKGIQQLPSDAHHHYFTLGAGENWHTSVDYLTANGWPGLENLALIPGTVGAAPIQNIGAYGATFADFCHVVRAFDWQSGTFVTFNRQACAFAYRDSLFKQQCLGDLNRYIITAVTLALPQQWRANLRYKTLRDYLASEPEPSAQNIQAAVETIRRSRLPAYTQQPNAGSFFKNPQVAPSQFAKLQAAYPNIPNFPCASAIKLSAGWLIANSDWPEKHQGAIRVAEQNALVLVRTAEADQTTVLRYAQQLMHAVQRQFAIDLEIEPVVLGRA